jgi:hypothetical protein
MFIFQRLFIEQCWSAVHRLARFQVDSPIGLAPHCAPGEAITIMTAILIVEDDVLANEHLEFILQQAGYEV